MNSVPVASIVVGDRHRKELGDIAALAASIKDVGLLQPLALTPDNRLVAGARRLAAAKALGWAEVPVHVVNGLDDAVRLLRAERDENTCRKNFTPSEAVSIGRALEELERAAADRRKKSGTNQHTEPSGKIPEGSKGQTRDKVAEAVGMSGRNYEKTKVVVEAAKKDPELRPVVEEMDRTGKVDPAYKKVRGRAAARQKRPLYYQHLDDETKAVLGEHPAGYRAGDVWDLCKIHDRARRKAVVTLLAEGKADKVSEAVAILDYEAGGDEPGYKRLLRAWSAASLAARDRFRRELSEGKLPS
jgi:ParB family chromosome partitioning protein